MQQEQWELTDLRCNSCGAPGMEGHRSVGGGELRCKCSQHVTLTTQGISQTKVDIYPSQMTHKVLHKYVDYQVAQQRFKALARGWAGLIPPGSVAQLLNVDIPTALETFWLENRNPRCALCAPGGSDKRSILRRILRLGKKEQ